MDKYAQNKASPFGSNPLVEVDQQTYGEGVPDNGAVVAKRLPILSISPDLRQPRRVVPHIVRGEWNGDPDDFISVLGNWHALVEEKLGHSIDLPGYLRGNGDLLDVVDDPIVVEYRESIKLAQTILADGQRESIEVWRRDPSGKQYVIQDGERRWVAHHLLNLHVSGDYGTILAVEKDRNVWAQATRNGAHRALNAIAMARQIALLLIAMYEGDAGVNFDSFERMVLPGECDRKYYAQVARGDLYPVKRGMLERVLSVTGMTSKNQLSQYRALLDLSDALWLQADTENWTEFAIRTRAQEDERVKAFAAGQADGLTAGNHISGNQTANEAVSGGDGSGIQDAPQDEQAPKHKPESTFIEGQLVLLHNGGGGVWVVELYRANERSFVDMLHARNANGVTFTTDATDVTPIDANTPLTHPQSVDLATFMGRRTVKLVSDEQPPAHLLTPAERDALDRAWNVMHRADPRFKGWYPAPPHLPDATRNMVMRGFLETSRRALWGRAEETCLRITPEGSRALGRGYHDPEGITEYGDPPKAATPRFDFNSYVYNTKIQRVGMVRGQWRESKATAQGAVNTEYVSVVVLGGGANEISWAEADLRAATTDEIAFWTKGKDDARGDEAKAGVETRQPDSATGGPVEAGTGRATGKVDREASPALFAEWATPEHTGLGEALRLLHTLASEPTKTRIQDLLTMTEDDLHELVEVTPVGTSPGGLNWLLATSESQITELIGRAILKPLNDYVLHLRALGKDIDTDVRG